MTCFGYESRDYSFQNCPVLDSNPFRTTISLHTKKTGSNFIVTMGNALLGGELLLSKKILVVEDSCDLRELLGKILASQGWNPILAGSGRRALVKLECETPRVILMDMRLPDMNGFELAAILKKHPVYRNIPILAATAYPGRIARQRCFAAGCDDFISKPFAISVLEARLTNLVSVEGQKTIAATGL
jgi:CheY-like chemotaxis protein